MVLEEFDRRHPRVGAWLNMSQAGAVVPLTTAVGLVALLCQGQSQERLVCILLVLPHVERPLRLPLPLPLSMLQPH